MSEAEGKVAIVTGAGAGIGLATVERLVGEGLRIVAVGRKPGPLDTLVERFGEKTIALHCADVTDPETPRASVARALERFGRLDCLVNNAGAGIPVPVHKTSDENLAGFVDVMLIAPFRYCREAVPHMKPGSAIVNVSSTFAVVGGMSGGAYSVAKAGLTGLTTTMAAEYGPSGIRTNAVAPGVVVTDMTRPALEIEAFRRNNFDLTPLGRLCRAEEVADAIWYLLSDQASFITGQILPVDGGWSSTRFVSREALTAQRIPG